MSSREPRPELTAPGSPLAGALAELVNSQGYRDVSSNDVIARAGLDAEEFHLRFAGKDECFMAVYEAAIALAIDRVTLEMETASGGHSDRIVAALSELLDFVAEFPELARMCLVETAGVGPAPRTRYESTLAAFAVLLRSLRKESAHGDRLPATLEESIAGGVLWFLHDSIVNRRVEHVGDRLPDLARFVLTPYFGAAEAQAAAHRGSRRPVRGHGLGP